MQTFRLIVLWGALCLSPFLDAAHHDLDKSIKQLEGTYRSIKDFQADFEQIQVNPLLNKKKRSTGTIYSLNKGRLFWHTKSPTPMKLVSDGKTIWLYYPKNKQLFKEKWEKLDHQTKIALLFLKREGNLKKNFKISWKEKGKKGVFSLIPKTEMGVEKVWLTLTQVGKKTFFKKLTFFFPLNKKTELILKKIKFDQNLWNKHRKKPLDPNINSDFQFISK